MLKQRIITGLILIMAVLAAIFYASYFIFILLTTALLLFASWEWSKLIGFQFYLTRTIYVLLMAMVMLSIRFLHISLILWAAFIFWVISFILIIAYPRMHLLWAKGKWVRACIGFFVLIPCWVSINTIRLAHDGKYSLLFLLCIVWGADIGAYVFGRCWGKHKLLPHVSPKKTWEGLYGGLLFTFLIAVIGSMAFGIEPPRWILVIIAALITALFSIVGDLLESMIKREGGFKDSGNYLPGHGGILDRIDSLTAAAPIFLLFCFVLKLVL